MAGSLTFKAIKARQSDQHEVFAFAATAQQVLSVARIDRAGRDEHGELFGFQRPQVSQHIHEIRDYLKRADSVLPNSVVLAFVDGVQIRDLGNDQIEVTIDISEGPPGLVVDGQQRLSALQPLQEREFQVFVSAILCKDAEELRRQFILVNNTRPLPKELIYELLPTVTGLPHRMSARSFAAHLATRLNYFEGEPEERDEGLLPALKGEIRQHTNPRGTIASNAVQRVIMNSRANGALRDFATKEDAENRSIKLISDFYGAVMDVFPDAWVAMSPRASRLKHSAGIIAMGYAMEMVYMVHGARTRGQFAETIRCLEPYTAWTSGYWCFESEMRPWDKIQNTPPDIRMLSDYLVRLVRDQGDVRSQHSDRSDQFERQAALVK